MLNGTQIELSGRFNLRVVIKRFEVSDTKIGRYITPRSQAQSRPSSKLRSCGSQLPVLSSQARLPQG